MKGSDYMKMLVQERMGIEEKIPPQKPQLLPLVEKWKGETEFWKKKASVSFNDEKKVALAFSSAISDCLADLEKAIAETENTSNND